jgi:UDP-N-acetylmuramate dehydrogenase
MQENVELQALNTFGLSARARFFCVVDSLAVLQDALLFAHEKLLPVFILGGGSNILLRDNVPGLVLHMQIKGIQKLSEAEGLVRVEVSCGENWHAFVTYCLAQGWHGLENLALIPGSVGAAPIQNIGAYGVEAGELIESVTALNAVTGEIETIASADCAFAYRDSVFKRQYKGSRIILRVVFLLHRSARVNVSYDSLAQALAGMPAPQPADVFAAVVAIRRNRLPDPAQLGNAGSFFKNPVIGVSEYASLKQRHADLPGHETTDSAVRQVKVPAAWLIERAGWKGRRLGQAGVYEKQSLVLVNHGAARADEIVALAQAIIWDVEQQFGILLEPEVQWVPGTQPGDFAMYLPQEL